MIINANETQMTFIEEIGNILNKEKKINSKITKKLNYLFFKYSMVSLNIKEIEVEYEKKNKNILGAYFLDKNKIMLNLNAINKSYPIDAFTTISHELRHCYKTNEKDIKKDFDVYNKSGYPLDNFNSFLFSILDIKHINLRNYYYTSKKERDARDFSIENVRFFCNMLFLTNEKNTLAHKWAKNSLKKIEKFKKKEEKKYNRALKHVQQTYKTLTINVKNKINKLLNINEFNVNIKNKNDLTPFVNKHIKNYLDVYCDNEIVRRILSYCIDIKDIETLLVCLNHPSSNINISMFENCLKFVLKNSTLTDAEIIERLSNWDKDVLSYYLTRDDIKINRKEIKQTNQTKNTVYDCSNKLTKKKNLKNFKTMAKETNNFEKNINLLNTNEKIL